MSYIVINLTIDWVWFFACVAVVCAFPIGVLVNLFLPTVKEKLNHARTKSLQRIDRRTLGTPVAQALTAAIRAGGDTRVRRPGPTRGDASLERTRTTVPRSLDDLR